MSAKHANTHGQWQVGHGYRSTAFTAERHIDAFRREYLNAKGEVKNIPSFFRSRDGALAAIAKATGGAS